MATARYQASFAGDNSTIALFRGWAGDVTGVNFALSSCGWTKQSDTYTAQWAGAITIGATALPTAAGTLTAGVFPAGAIPLPRTALASTHFKGAWVTLTAYVAGDVVTDSTTAAAVYICTVGNSDAGAPTTNLTKWSPYYMEIWKSGGSLTAVYLKIEYGNSATAANPQMYMQFGTGWSGGASGFLSGNVTSAEPLFNGAGVIATTECDFCGDGSNFFVASMFRGGAANPGPAIFGWERSINGTVASAPNYTSDYLTYIKGYGAVTNWAQQTLFLSGTPTTATRILYGNTMTLGGATLSLIVNNTTPAFPLWPLVGYCGNPMTILIAQQTTDTTEGAQQTCTVYGANHNYMMTKTTFALGLGGLGQTTMYGVGTRFDAS